MNNIKMNDPRITHVIPLNLNEYESRIQQYIFKRKKMHFRFGGGYTNEIIRYAKKFCSGRECFAFHGVVGNIYKDIMENESAEEVTVYWSIDQCGPCQVGAWPGVLDVMMKNVQGDRQRVFVGHPNVKNNYFNFGFIFAFEYMIANIIGNILDEAKSALYAAALDRESALKLFETEASLLIAETGKGINKVWRALKKWAQKMKAIPLKKNIREIPKILIFGGNAPFFNKAFFDYFTENGVIVKSDNFSDYLLHVESECMRRFGVRRGIADIYKQSKILPIILSFLNPRYSWSEVYRALLSVLSLASIEFLFKRLRKIAARSGLLFDRHYSYIDLLASGHELIEVNNFCDAVPALGRYLYAVKNDVYNGSVYLTPFSCTSGLMGETMVKTLTNKYDLACATIQISDVMLTMENKKILENILVQAKRMKEKELRQ